MEKKYFIFFLGICPILPAVAHFSDGVIFFVEFWLLFLADMFAGFYIRVVYITHTPKIVEHMVIISASVFYYLCMQYLFPLNIYPFEPYIYIFCFSYLMIKKLNHNKRPFTRYSVYYSLVIIIISLTRELFCFGTCSLPIPPQFVAIQVLNSIPFLRFLGSSAGIVIAAGMLLWLKNSAQCRSLLRTRRKHYSAEEK